MSPASMEVRFQRKICVWLVSVRGWAGAAGDGDG